MIISTWATHDFNEHVYAHSLLYFPHLACKIGITGFSGEVMNLRAWSEEQP
jgi:hypothetical protein